MITKKIIVTGKVQGVFFRQSTLQKALELGVTGAVENMPDGNSVTIVATGMEGRLASLISWCQQGPPRANVKNVQISDLPLQVFENFSIL